jgi:hypothetical protein
VLLDQLVILRQRMQYPLSIHLLPRGFFFAIELRAYRNDLFAKAFRSGDLGGAHDDAPRLAAIARALSH